jgi:arylsulfatase A-like enzyme
LIGKWHLGDGGIFHPNQRGFDEFCGMLSGGHTYFPGTGKNQIQRNGKPVTKFPSSYLTDFFTDEAIRWMGAKDDKPFFLYLSYNAPHTPMEATEEDLKAYSHIEDKNRRTYAAMIRALDCGVGRVLDWLKTEDKDSNTLVVFLSDNGGGHRYFPEELTLQNTDAARNESDSYKLWIMRDHTPVKTTQYLTDEFSDEAVSFIGRHKAEPFFLYLAYNAPHSPLQASEKYLARFKDIKDGKRRTYAAMVSAVDDGVGEVLAKLRELGIEENTMMVFLSDNGGPTSDNASDNRPLRGGKGSLTEGGIRVPFAAQWPGRIPKGLVYQHPVISLDILATIAALPRPRLIPPARWTA